MRREDAELEVGTVLTIRGRRGRVVSLTAARVRVDFNPPFSGRKVRGVFRIEKRITEAPEQVRGLIELTYGRGKEFQVEVHAHAITVQVPDRAKFDVNWMAAKPRLIDRIRSQLHPTTVKIVEEYVTPTAKEEKKEKGKDSPKSKPEAAPETAAPATEAKPETPSSA
jgi:hypothetical protein